jgi:mannose-6-phosphate isomerase
MEARMSRPAPIRFEPILKRLIWGGRRLGTALGKPIGAEPDYAESWELSDHRNGRSVVATGPLAGRTLGELLEVDPDGLLGPGPAGPRQFPLLVKFIDARETLSVQVHPDDAKGRRLADDNGKTEAWVILDAEPGALIYAGLRPGVTPDAFERAMASGEVEPLLHHFPARPGDCVFIPAGTIHAIGAGVLLAEVQQMSDTTFRVHDWGRVGPDGKPRELHPAQSMACIDFEAGPVSPVVPARRELPGEAGVFEGLVDCPEFRLGRWRLEPGGEVAVGGDGRFLVLIGAEGEAVVEHGGESFSVARGRTLLLPASAGMAKLTTGTGPAAVLGCTKP